MLVQIIVIGGALLVLLFALAIGHHLWRQFTVSGNISTLLESCDTLERTPDGESKRAYERLVSIGVRVLPALEAKNAQLIAEHRAYSEWHMAISSKEPISPDDDSMGKFATRARGRYVIETKQARIVDVMREITGKDDDHAA